MSRANPRLSVTFAAAVLGVAASILLTGCGARGEIVLHQPFAPASQKNLKLSGKAAFRAASGDRQSCAMTFPLPRSAAGPRAFVLYLTAPDQLGQVPVTPFEPGAVGGFLIQEVGDLSGRSDFLSGSITFRKVWLGRRLLRADFNVRCEDGTEITGRAYLQDRPPRVRAIEREFAADVRLVSAPQESPAPGPETAPRGAATTRPARP